MNSRRAKIIAIAIGVILIIIDGALYVSKSKAPQTPPLTNAEEAVLQQRIADIIASKKGTDCATLSNETYRLACEQILNVPQGGQTTGVLLQTVPAAPMTEAQLRRLVKNSSSQPRYSITMATTTMP